MEPPKGTGLPVPRRPTQFANAENASAPRGQSGLSPSALRAPLAAALFSALILITPPADPHFRLCGFHWLTGHPCALCGMTRAMFALAKGHVVEAVRFNALAPLGFAMVFSLFLTGRAAAIAYRLWPAGLAAFGIYGICRLVLA